MLALFDNIGFGELLLVVIVALLVFGRRLPEVAGQAGSQIAKLKRSLEDLRQESGIDQEVRRMQDEIRKARDVIPRNLSIGEMARMASTEIEKRVQANELADAAEKEAPSPSPGTPAVEPSLRSDPVRADGTPIGAPATAPAPDASAARERAYAAGTPSFPSEGGSAPPRATRVAPVLGAPLDDEEPRDSPPAAG